MRVTDEDGVDGPFERGMARAIREDAKAARRLRKPVLRKPARLNLYLESDLLGKLARYAERRGLDVSKAAREILAAGLAEAAK